ncbi:MAG: helix-turn-helix domain-containing protein [Halobacteria archaeon]|nr:helix-turn-helix domain-containing protein [Halobacteria archaeon]
MTETSKPETARKIESYIRDNPGVHFSGIVEGLGTAPGQTQYHVFDLLDVGDVVSLKLYGRAHYYLPEYDDSEWEKGALALLRRETPRDVVVYLVNADADADGVKPADVADSLGIARSTLEYHLDRLVEQDIVKKTREENRVRLELEKPEKTVEMLVEVEPPISETMVDRFMRLVDNVMDE